VATNVPAIVFADCDAIVYWKLPHVLADGSVVETDEVQTPTSDGAFDVVDVGVPAGLDVPPFDADDGDRTLEACWKPHAANIADATRNARTGTDRLLAMVTNLSADARFSRAPRGRVPKFPRLERGELIR
jgi:hypothetical protein